MTTRNKCRICDYQLTEHYSPTDTLCAHCGYVYVIRRNKEFKIGHTKQWKTRLSNLSPDEVICLITSKHSRQLERDFHKKYQGFRVRGEWFDLNSEHVSELRCWHG